MGKTYSEEEVIQRVYDANKQRGKYLAFIVKELDQAGFKDFDGALRKAIFNFGKDKGAKCGNFNAKGFMNYLINDDVIKGIVGYEEVGASDENRAEFTFNRCPLEEGWKEMGLSADERHRLCSIASEHDFGFIANGEDLELEMPEGIGLGHSNCRLIAKKKD